MDSAMDIDDAISSRRSVREYTTQAVDEQTIRHLINAAIFAPNAVNQQPWTFTVVRDQGLLARISRDAKSYMLVTMAASPHSDHFRSLLNDQNFQIFYHAPVLMLISASAQGPWIIEDCALAAENLMLAACATGLGTCWIGFAQSFLNTPEGRRRLTFLPAVCRSRLSSSAIRRARHRRSRASSRKFAGSADGYPLFALTCSSA
jgi:nitroreductase